MIEISEGTQCKVKPEKRQQADALFNQVEDLRGPAKTEGQEKKVKRGNSTYTPKVVKGTPARNRLAAKLKEYRNFLKEHKAGQGETKDGGFVRKGDERFNLYVVPGHTLRTTSKDDYLRIGARNLGALRYYLENNKTELVSIPANTPLEISDDLHTEIILLKKVPLPEQGCPVVTQVYSERIPCPKCSPALEKRAKDNNSGQPLTIYYITHYAGDGYKDNLGKRLPPEVLAKEESAVLLRGGYDGLDLDYPNPFS